MERGDRRGRGVKRKINYLVEYNKYSNINKRTNNTQAITNT